LDILNKVGIAAIREKSLRLTARLLAGAKQRGWHVNTPLDAAERAGTVSIECPHASEVCRELVKRNILVDYRPKAGVRISPHFYNSESECDFTLAQMEEIIETLEENTGKASISRGRAE
jgi:kynureninase